jgi:hypothetical protein
MTDREGLFSKGRNPNSSQPVPRHLTFKYRFCQAGERKKDSRGPPSGPEALPGRRRPFFQNAEVLRKIISTKIFTGVPSHGATLLF